MGLCGILFKMTQLNWIFPTPLWHIEKELPAGVYEWALEHQKNNLELTGNSSCGGYQNYFDISKIPFFNYIQDCLYFLPKFEYLNAWLNINKDTDHNILHYHPNSDLAVIWYLTDNDNKLYFKSPYSFSRYNLYSKFNNPEELGLELSPICKAGDILIFPADLLHGVSPTYKKEPRISISFNLKLND